MRIVRSTSQMITVPRHRFGARDVCRRLPPRLDFSAKPGLVCVADEYPLPPGVDLSACANAAAA